MVQLPELSKDSRTRCQEIWTEICTCCVLHKTLPARQTTLSTNGIGACGKDLSIFDIHFDAVRPHARIGVRAWAGLAATVFFLRHVSGQQVEVAPANADPFAHLQPLRS